MFTIMVRRKVEMIRFIIWPPVGFLWYCSDTGLFNISCYMVVLYSVVDNSCLTHVWNYQNLHRKHSTFLVLTSAGVESFCRRWLWQVRQHREPHPRLHVRNGRQPAQNECVQQKCQNLDVTSGPMLHPTWRHIRPDVTSRPTTITTMIWMYNL